MSIFDSIKEWSGIIGTVLSIVVTLMFIYKSMKLTPKEVRQSDVETISKYASVTGSAVDQLKNVIDELGEYSDKFEIYRDLVDSLYCGVEILIGQLKELGAEPRWTPPPKKTL